MVGVKKKYWLAIIVLGLIIFLFNLGDRDLWEPDETRYAVIAREMRETGQWVLPHLNKAIYAEKPPLFFWLVNLSVFLLGEGSELANRLPSALAGWITILLTFLLGERLFNSRVGFLSASVLATCLFFPLISRWMMLDSLFTLLFLLTLYCFYLGYEKEEGRRQYYILAGLFMGFGVLTKGPVAYLGLPIFLIFAFSQRGLKKFWSYDLLLGFLLSLAVVLAWLIPACLLGGEDYTKRILLEQTVGRISGSASHVHAKPFSLYFVRFPIEFLPWIVFLPIASVFAFRRGEVKRKKELLFLFVWFISIFVFFTFSRGKKDNYILPLYPAAAIIVGWFWESLISSGKGEKYAVYVLLLSPCLVLIAFVLLLFTSSEQLFPALIPYRFWVISMLSYIVVGLSISLLSFVNGNKWASFMCIVITFAILHLHISYSLPARFNARWSMKAFSQRILKRMQDGDELKVYPICPPGLLYYTRKGYLEEITNRERFLMALRSPQRVFVVIKKGHLGKLMKDSGMEVKILDQERVYLDLVLVSNR